MLTTTTLWRTATRAAATTTATRNAIGSSAVIRMRATTAHQQQRSMSSSLWSNVPQGPIDPILGVTDAFKRDTDPRKVNLGVGAYRDDRGQPVVLPSVAEATRRIYEAHMNNEYAPIGGEPEFARLAIELAYGSDHPLLAQQRVAAIQSLSGTGALRLIGAFLARFWKTTPVAASSTSSSSPPPLPTLYVPDPTWGTHNTIFGDCGFKTATYRYYLPANKGLDTAGLLADIRSAPPSSVFLFHACAHNPTGVDPSPDEWRAISAAVKERGHFVIVDSAYQGFASGDPVRDSQAIMQFLADGHPIALAQSFAKNFGMYGQRVGCASFVTRDATETARVESQLRIIARALYSNPPIHGSRIVSLILKDPELREQWKRDVREMAERIQRMRALLRSELEALGSVHDWHHITEQIGMFCYSGLSAEQVDRLASEYHIYMTRNGRISMAGLTTTSVPYVARAIHDVSK